MELYRETRAQAQELLHDVQQRGYDGVHISGEGDIADVCRLTCLEQGLEVLSDGEPDGVPTVEIQGTDLELRYPEDAPGPQDS